jgi:hypothetical protein
MNTIKVPSSFGRRSAGPVWNKRREEQSVMQNYCVRTWSTPLISVSLLICLNFRKLDWAALDIFIRELNSVAMWSSACIAWTPARCHLRVLCDIIKINMQGSNLTLWVPW